MDGTPFDHTGAALEGLERVTAVVKALQLRGDSVLRVEIVASRPPVVWIEDPGQVPADVVVASNITGDHGQYVVYVEEVEGCEVRWETVR